MTINMQAMYPTTNKRTNEHTQVGQRTFRKEKKVN